MCLVSFCKCDVMLKGFNETEQKTAPRTCKYLFFSLACILMYTCMCSQDTVTSSQEQTAYIQTKREKQLIYLAFL